MPIFYRRLRRGNIKLKRREKGGVVEGTTSVADMPDCTQYASDSVLGTAFDPDERARHAVQPQQQSQRPMLLAAAVVQRVHELWSSTSDETLQSHCSLLAKATAGPIITEPWEDVFGVRSEAPTLDLVATGRHRRDVVLGAINEAQEEGALPWKVSHPKPLHVSGPPSLQA